MANARKAAETTSNGEERVKNIAAAYEKWLTGPDVIKNLVGQINQSLASGPTDGAAARRGLLGQIVTSAGPRTGLEAARAVIDIGDLVIELDPPGPQPTPGQPVGESRSTAGSPRVSMRDHLEQQHDLEERGVLFDPGAAFTQVPV
jgi:hypothetical protein